MRYLYGATDEKFIPSYYLETKKKPKPLDSFKFRLNHLLESKKKLKRGDCSIRFKTTPDTAVELCSPVVNAIPLPRSFQWTTLDVADWIKKLGFPQYQSTFKRNKINGHTLIRMDASYLVKINIRDFEHIQIITNSIRKLYGFEKSSFTRNITLPARTWSALYKFFRIRTGPKYQSTRRTDLYRKLHLLRPRPLYETHWQTLIRWLKHLRPTDTELIGGTIRKRYNLYYPPKTRAPLIVPKKIYHECTTCMPPCTCLWTKEKHLREPWKLKCLRKTATQEKCTASCDCTEPCTCRWPKVPARKELTLLKIFIPHKYAKNDMRVAIDRYIKVRLSTIPFNKSL